MEVHMSEFIPSGCYCYEFLGIEKDSTSEFGFKIKTKPCPYYSKKDYWCMFLDMEIFDECKECGINDDDEDYDVEGLA
jgi:hypothetical protein